MVSPSTQRPGALRAWVQASRLPTLWAAFSPVAVGSACAARFGCFDAYAAALCLLGAVLIQLGTNYANDLFDHRKGADGRDRLGPTRAVAAGWLSERAMMTGTVVAFAAATLVGVALFRVAGWPIVIIGLTSLTAGVFYTAGPAPLAYTGLGDVFVLLFFGFVAVCGTAFVQCGSVPATAWLGSVAVGALATAILVVNNLRDIETDAASGKRTLAVRLGRRLTRGLYLLLLLLAFATPPALVLTGQLTAAGWLPLLALPLALSPARSVLSVVEGPPLNRALAATARLLLVFGLLFSPALARWF